MTLPTIDQLHAGLRDLIVERVEIEPLILGARVGMGSETLANTLLRDAAGFMLDPVGAGSDAQFLGGELTRSVITRIQPLEALGHPDRAAERARLELARRYGSDLTPAVAAATDRAADPSAWTITRALGSSPQGQLLAVRDTHRLAETVMWELRDLAAQGVRLLLLTTPEHRPRLLGRDAPFYGMSAYVEMPTLPLINWVTKLGGWLPGETLAELLRQTRYRTAITLEVLDDYERRGGPDIASSWFRAIDRRDAEARMVLSLARSIHELAPRLLLTLARDEAPYARTTERSDRVALALRHLRDYDLIEQPEPRRWQIADPLLSAAIRRLRDGYIDLYPEIEASDSPVISSSGLQQK